VTAAPGCGAAVRKPHAGSRVPLGEPGDLFDEGLPHTGNGQAAESPDQQVNHGSAARNG
jgi:hypothetical protein